MNILASIRSMTINLGPDIPSIEVYTTEQLYSLVMNDDNPKSITQAVFDHYGLYIVDDFEDTMVMLEGLYGDFSIEMKKGLEKFCMKKMKELEGQPEYLGHYLAFTWGVLFTWEIGTWANTIKEFFQNNPELRDEFVVLWGGDPTEATDAEPTIAQPEDNEQSIITNNSGLKGTALAMKYLKMTSEEQDEFKKTLTDDQIDELIDALCEFESVLHTRTCNALCDAYDTVESIRDLSQDYGDCTLSDFELAIQVAILRETIKRSM